MRVLPSNWPASRMTWVRDKKKEILIEECRACLREGFLMGWVLLSSFDHPNLTGWGQQVKAGGGVTRQRSWSSCCPNCFALQTHSGSKFMTFCGGLQQMTWRPFFLLKDSVVANEIVLVHNTYIRSLCIGERRICVLSYFHSYALCVNVQHAVIRTRPLYA